uniref:Bromo domain-containing protein n=1 Tax=Lactuca sativa TaxID=4236 RepID=A0A9R1UDE1_LACSA|nr:hypothetical protein LSAT_V11C900504560 [Lactuca sativa]
MTKMSLVLVMSLFLLMFLATKIVNFFYHFSANVILVNFPVKSYHVKRIKWSNAKPRSCLCHESFHLFNIASRYITMKRKRAPKKDKLEMPLAKKRLQNIDALMAEKHVMNDEPEKITSVHMETENPRTTTSATIRSRQTDLEIGKIGYGEMTGYPKALGDIIVTVLKEISKEAGGLANLTKSLVDNSISNGQMEQPHADMDLEEKESQHHQNPEYNQEELDAALTTMKLDAADPFNRPVDPVELGIPDYLDVIDTPMDFGTICNNLENGLKYMNSADVFKDVQYIWYNCVKYNKKGDYILELMKRVKAPFMKYWKAAGLQTAQSPPIIESSILKEKDHPLSPPANNVTLPPQNKAGPIQVAEIDPIPINIQNRSQSQSQGQVQNQTPQNSTPQSSSEQDDDPQYCIPDSRSIQKKRQFHDELSNKQKG